MRDPGLEIAIKAAGGVASLARGIGIAQPSVSAWSRIPAKRVLAVEALTRVDRCILRPDLYGSFQAHPINSEPDAIDRLRAAGHSPLSLDLPHAEPHQRFAKLDLSELAITKVQLTARNAPPLNDKCNVVYDQLKQAFVAELMRQAEIHSTSLSVSGTDELVVNGKIDLKELVKAILPVFFQKP